MNDCALLEQSTFEFDACLITAYYANYPVRLIITSSSMRQTSCCPHAKAL